MALIQCNECGSMVSEKSDVCMKCGNPVSEIMKEINKKKKQKKKKILTIGCVFAGIIVIGLVAAFLFLHFRADKNEFYADIEWGSSYDEDKIKLKELYKDKFRAGDGDNSNSLFAVVENYMGDDGIKASIQYDYKDEKLDSVIIMVTNDDDDSVLTMEQLSEKYEKILDKKYGGKKEEQEDSSNQVWTLSDSTVELRDYDSFVIIRFKTQ